MSPRVTSNWSALTPQDRARRGAPSNAAALRDEVITAKERVMRALMAVGPEVSGILVGGRENERLALTRRQGRTANRADKTCQTLRVDRA